MHLFSSYSCWQLLMNQTRQESRERAALSDVYANVITNKLSRISDDLQRIYTSSDLAPGEHIFLSSTGVTDSELLRGVRFFGGGSRTASLLMSLTDGMIRFVDTIRRDVEQVGVAARNHQRHESLRHLVGRAPLRIEKGRVDVALDVMHGLEGTAEAVGDRAAERQADQQRADQARATGRGDHLDLGRQCERHS